MSDPRTAPIRTFNWGDWEDMVAERDAYNLDQWNEHVEACKQRDAALARVRELEAALDEHGWLVPVLERDKLQAHVAKLREALEGLRYKKEPTRFCDHAADPCDRCEAAHAVLEEIK